MATDANHTANGVTDEVLRDLAQEAVGYLASFDRPSASDGERRGADWIAARLREEGCDAVVEEERAHGTYWWPLGLMTLLSGLAGLLPSRLVRMLAGGTMAAAVADDISGGRLWFRRAVLPQRPTWNVVAEAGDREADRTVVLVAHHDAAHWSLLFAPHVPRFFGEHFPGLVERSRSTPPVMFPVFGGPLLVALGGLTGSRRLRRAGAVVSLGAAATFARDRIAVDGPGRQRQPQRRRDAARRRAAAARAPDPRAARPARLDGLRGVVHGGHAGVREAPLRLAAATSRTHVVCIDTVGSPTLMQLEGEGMLVMRDYPQDFKDLVSEAAEQAGVQLVRGLWFRNATDGLIALKAGYPTVMLGSINRYKVPDNYHWPTDTADNVDYSTVAGAARVCDGVVRRLASSQG